MLFLENSARVLLVAHAVVGAAAVAAATHLVVWLKKRRHAGVRWFALAVCVLYAVQFALGNFIYPVYRVRVRAEYLDQPGAVAAAQAARSEARANVDALARAQAAQAGRASAPPSPAPAADEEPALAGEDPADAAQEPLPLYKVARTFDIKEHWAALGLALALGVCFLARRHPAEAGPRDLLFALALGAALAGWIAALIGVWVTLFRAI